MAIEDLEYSSVVSKMTHFTSITINPEDQDTYYLASLMDEKHQEKHPYFSLAPPFYLPTETASAEIPSSNRSKDKPPSIIEGNNKVISETSSDPSHLTSIINKPNSIKPNQGQTDNSVITSPINPQKD